MIFNFPKIKKFCGEIKLEWEKMYVTLIKLYTCNGLCT